MTDSRSRSSRSSRPRGSDRHHGHQTHSGHADREPDAPGETKPTEGGSRAERKERTRRRLLDVTLRLMQERSLASISLREVAREAGIVPTAFYRHYDSVDALGVDLVDDCMHTLRQMTRDARRGRVQHQDIIVSSVQTLDEHVAAHQDQFRFLVRERYGGVESVRRAITTELRLFTSDLTVDLARLTSGLDWSSEDLEITSELMMAAMTTAVIDLLEVDDRRPEERRRILRRSEKQLRLITLGMGQWRSTP